MRGVMPPGAELASGTISSRLSPTLTRKRRAVISPITTPDSPAFNASRLPRTMCWPMIETCCSSCGSMPLTSIGCIMPL
ncbi:hypothetical protein D3C80_1730800 [compost metagenome]